MTDCTKLVENIENQKALYNEIEAAYKKLPGHTTNNLASAIRGVINTAYQAAGSLKKYPVVGQFIEAAGGKFSDLFTERSATFDSFAFQDPEIFTNADTLITAIVEHGVNEKLATRLANNFFSYKETYQTKVAADTASPFKGNKTIRSWVESPLQILLEENSETGNFELPDAVLFNMMVISLQQATTLRNQMTPKEASQLIYGDTDHWVGTEVYEALQQNGTNRNTVVLSIGSAIFHSLNVKVTDKIAGELEKRIKYSLGLMAVGGIGTQWKIGNTPLFTQTNGVVNTAKQTIDPNSGKPTRAKSSVGFSLVARPSNNAFKQIGDAFKEYREDISLLLGAGTANANTSTQPIKHVHQGIRNSIFSINRKVASTIRTLQSVAWTKNQAFSAFELLDRETVLALHGWKDPSTVHVDERLAQEAKNYALEKELDDVIAYNELGNLDKFYMPYKAMNTNRLTQLGDISPQNSKLHRALFTVLKHGESKVNSDKLRDLFKLAVAQAFDQDIDKTDLVGGLELFEQLFAKTKVDGSPIAKAIDAYRDSDKAAFNKAMRELQQEFGAGPSLMKGVVALSQFTAHTNSKGKTSTFTTDITIESDGITNGFAISLLQFAGGLYKNGQLTDIAIQQLNQVGITLPYQISSVGKRSNENFDDAYTQFGRAIKEIIANPTILEALLIPGETPFADVFTDALGKRLDNADDFNLGHVLHSLNVIGFDLTNETMIRKIAKNPFMIFNYGAGINSIAANMAADTVSIARNKTVDLQEAYNAEGADRQAIEKEAVEFFQHLEVFGNSRKSEKWVTEKLASNALHNAPIDTQFNVESNLTVIYKAAIEEASRDVLGHIGDFRDAFIQAAELQYFAFVVRLEGKLDEMGYKGKDLAEKFGQLTQNEQIALIKSPEIISVYPQYVGPFAGLQKADENTITDAIDLIKANFNPSERNIVKVPVNPEFRPKNRKVPSTQLTSLDFDAPGAAALIRPIQNMDSVILSLVIQATGGNISPIHDAVDTPLHLAEKAVNAYNMEYILRNEQFSAVTQVGERLQNTFDNILTDAEKEIVHKRYLKEAFQNKYKKSKKDLIDYETVFNKVLNIAEHNDQARKDLFEVLKQPSTLVEQMYLPVGTDSVGEIQLAGFKSSFSEFQLNSNYPSIKANQELFEQVQQSLQQLYPHISSTLVEGLVNEYGQEVLGRAFGSMVEYSQDAKLDTLPHEYAHVYINMLESTTFMQRTLEAVEKTKKVNRAEAKEILAEHMGRKYVDTMFIKAKIEGDSQLVSLAIRIWKTLQRIFHRITLGKLATTDARMAMDEAAYRFRRGFSGEAIRIEPADGFVEMDVDTILSNNPTGAQVLKEIIQGIPAAALTGSTALAAQGKIYRKTLDSLHDLDFRLPRIAFKGANKFLTEYYGNRITPVYNFLTKEGKNINSFIIAPEGTEIRDLRRYKGRKFGRVESYNIVDNTTNEVVGTYKADIQSKPKERDIYGRLTPIGSFTEIVDEHYWNQKAVIVDLLEGDLDEFSVTYHSNVLDTDLQLTGADTIFAAKNSLSQTGIPRSKDVRDFVLFQPSKSGITDPRIFEEPRTIGASVESVRSTIHDLFDNAHLTTNINKIFSMLSGFHNGYASEQAHAEETAHLQRVLRSIVMKATHHLDGVRVGAGTVNGKSVGQYNLDAKKIDLNISDTVPLTYTEQSDQEIFVHETLHPILRLVFDGKLPILGKLEDIRSHVRSQMTWEDFMPKDEQGNIIYRTDPKLEEARAKEQYEYFLGPYYTNSAGEVVPSTLEEFTVGALTNKHMIAKLNSLTPPRRNQWWEGYTYVQIIGNLVATLVDAFMHKFRQGDLSPNMYEQVFKTVQQITTAQMNQRQHIAFQLAIEAKNKLYSKFASGVDLGLKTLSKDGKGETFIPNAAHVLRHLPETLQNAKTQEAFTKAYSALSKAQQRSAVIALLKDITVGTTNVVVDKMLLLTKHLVEAGRKHTEQAAASTVRKRFLTGYENITEEEHVALTKLLLRTDLSSLMSAGKMSMSDIVDLLTDPNKLSKQISAYEQHLNLANNSYYAQQTAGLAQLIVRRKTNTRNQRLNASAIHVHHITQTGENVNRSTIDMLDAYVTLKAIQLTPDSVIKTALGVIQREQKTGTENGITYLLGHHNTFKETSKSKLFKDNPILMQKGYLADLTDPYIDIKAAPKSEEMALKREGYKIVGTASVYSGLDGEPVYLYVNRNFIDPARVSGILSFTERRASGTSLFDILGREKENQTKDPITGDMIPNAAKIRVLIDNFARQQEKQAIHEQKMGVSNQLQLIPLTNEVGDISDYRAMMPYLHSEEIFKVGKGMDMHIDRMIGRMNMHQKDKEQSEKLNKDSVDFLVNDFNKEYQANRDAFIDLFDKRYYESFYIHLPKDLKQLIRDNAVERTVKGETQYSFKMRHDYLITFFGFKRKSLGNAEWLKMMPRTRNAGISLERLWMDVVTVAVANIVIKTAIVPAFNLLSNVFVSLVSGINPMELIKYWTSGWKNIEIFKKDARELMEVFFELQSKDISKTNLKKLTDRYYELQGKLQDNPVRRLIDLGLFTSISEDVEMDDFSYLNRMTSALGDAVSRHSPETLQSVARNLYMNKHTRIFKELHHFTQTMDFVARYGMYQHLVNKKKVEEDAALTTVFDAFILYDKPLNPNLDYMNKMGLIMFVKFWLNIQKFLYKQAKQDPANVAMLLLAQELSGTDVPDIFDSAIILGDVLPPIGGLSKIYETVVTLPLIDQVEAATDLEISPL